MIRLTHDPKLHILEVELRRQLKKAELDGGLVEHAETDVF